MLEMDFIEEINSKYSAMENELDQRYKKCSEEERQNMAQRKLEKTNKKADETRLNLEDAKKRNADLIKSLEMAKARLRSRSTYSPIETILEKALKNYSLTLQESQPISLNRHCPSTYL